MAGGKVVKPKIEKYILISMRDEIFALLHFLKYQWYIVAAIVALVAFAVSAYNPVPPSKIRIASGQVNSTLEVIAKRYQTVFAEGGVEVELVTTRGAVENLEALRDGRADIALSQGGAALSNANEIVSLGSIGYQPLWYFHRGEPQIGTNIFEVSRGKRISIGLEGSGTRLVLDAILDLVSPDVRSTVIFIELAAGASIEALRNGSIDGMFLVAGIESGNVQALLGSPGVQFYDFSMAEGLTRQLPFMEVVKVPHGALGLSPARPTTDTFMAATTTTVLARETLHPAIQHLFLKSATAFYSRDVSFFDRPGGFPAFIDKSTPRSDTAERYIANGPLLLDRHLPHWLASFLSVSWFWLVALVAVAFPLAKLTPSYRKVMFDVVLSDLYGRLFAVYRIADETKSFEELDVLCARHAVLAHEIGSLWVPKGCSTQYGFLLQAVETVSVKIAERAGSSLDTAPDGYSRIKLRADVCR
jgi:TRAP-type uncharacterized transport system substrate-binding protein